MDESEIVCEYQVANAREKAALMLIRDCREVIAAEIDRIMEDGRLRSVKRETLRRARTVAQPASHAALDPKEMVAAISEVPLRLEVWNAVRAAAEACDDPAVPEWRKRSEEAARLRNTLLERYVAMTPNIRKRYLPHAPAHMESDLEREGLLGMIRGMDTFDPKKGKDLRAHMIGWATSAMVGYLRGTDDARSRAATQPADDEDDPNDAANIPGQSRGGFGRRLAFGKRSKGASALIRLDASPEDGGEAIEHSTHEIISTGLGHAMELAERSALQHRLAAMVEASPPLERIILGLRIKFAPDRRLKTIPLSPEAAFVRLRIAAAHRFQARLIVAKVLKP